MTRRMLRTGFALWALAAIATPAAAAPPGFAALEIPAGARISALAGAGETLARGADAIFWNPAALSDTKGIQFTASHFELYQDLHHDDVALGGRMFGGGVAT